MWGGTASLITSYSRNRSIDPERLNNIDALLNYTHRELENRLEVLKKSGGVDGYLIASFANVQHEITRTQRAFTAWRVQNRLSL